jgi:hypothetical protein
MTPEEEFESLQEEARARWVRALPTAGLWGGNPVPRGEVRGSYRLLDVPSMDLPIIHGTLGSVQSLVGNALIEDLRKRNRGIPERIFTKSD